MGVLEHQALMVHHTSPGFIRSRYQPTPGYSWPGDGPTHHTSQSSSRRGCRSNNQPTHQSTMIWTDSQSGRASLSSRLDNANLEESTLTINDYMWTRSFKVYGSWLDLETIKDDPLSHYQSWILCNI
jgi:hypothetical protein